MIRAVLVGWGPQDWRIYRQPQWMAEVRRDPQAATLPRHHFDVPEESFAAALKSWEPTVDEQVACSCLEQLGGIKILPP